MTYFLGEMCLWSDDGLNGVVVRLLGEIKARSPDVNNRFTIKFFKPSMKQTNVEQGESRGMEKGECSIQED